MVIKEEKITGKIEKRKIMDIKYRAYHKENNKMYDVKEISIDHKEIVVKRGHEKEEEIKAQGGHFCSNCDSEYDDWFCFQEIELMQYIGLKDKNGVEIFEGDIIQSKTNYNWSDIKGAVYFDETFIAFMVCGVGLIELNPYETEVIGNVHQDKEVLLDV